MYKLLVKPILFLFPPEQAHHVTISLLRFLYKIPFVKSIFAGVYGVENKSLNKQIMGIDFPNPVGLAAGFDKDAGFINEMAMLGFGFIEVGTVTPKPQNGNPKPRLFRLPKDEALINRMGFNNQGVESMVQRLKKLKKRNVVIGGNIGKNKVTPNEDAIDDYLNCFTALFDYVDYFAVNVSSPNTPNLRALQDKEPLTAILSRLQKENQNHPKPKPILLKIAPDLNQNQLNDIVEIVKTTKLSGVIATNTTIDRSGLKSNENLIGEKGGLSGKPVKNRSTEIISFLRKELGSNYVIIGVGGIHHPNDAIEKINAGADLIQVYSGMVYEGPSLVKRINRAIVSEGL